VIVADEQEKTQNAAGDAAEAKADKQAKPRAARKPAAKPAAAKATDKAAPAKRAAAKADKADKAAEAKADEAAAKPARRKAAKPAAADTATDKAAEAEPVAATTETAAEAVSEAPTKPARKRALKAAAKADKAPAEPARRKAARPAPRELAHHAPDQRTAVVVDAAGARVDEIGLSPERFGLTPDLNLLHLAVRVEQAARRRGTASTRTRGEVSGSTAKLYRQKGTGRARAGSVKSPTRSGGGTAFGPKPRSYDLKINRKAARKALAMALSDRAEGGTIFVARGLDLSEPSTRTVDELLVALDIPAPVLFLTDDEPVVERSVRNLRYAETGEARVLSVEQVLRNRSIVVTEKALSVLTGA
jgi:large subunit ribosomal protein L4